MPGWAIKEPPKSYARWVLITAALMTLEHVWTEWERAGLGADDSGK